MKRIIAKNSPAAWIMRRLHCFIRGHNFDFWEDQREGSTVRRCERCGVAHEICHFDYWRRIN